MPTPSPLTPSAPLLRLRPTNRSNVAASTCGSTDALRLAHELPAPLAGGALKDAARLGYRRLIVDGGEPLLASGLPALLTRARRLGFDTTLVTNGTLLHQPRRWSAVAPHLGRVAISLFGTREQHDEILRRDGAYDLALQNLAHVRIAGVPYGFVLFLSTENLPHLPALLRVARAESASFVRLEATFDGGLSEEQLAEAVLTAAPLAHEYGFALEHDLTARHELMLRRDDFVPVTPSRRLTAVAPALVIEASGHLRPLSTDLPAELMLGSLHRARLSEFAPAWLTSTRALALADACDRAWWALVAPEAPSAARWATEVALHVDVQITARDRTTSVASPVAA